MTEVLYILVYAIGLAAFMRAGFCLMQWLLMRGVQESDLKPRTIRSTLVSVLGPMLGFVIWNIIAIGYVLWLRVGL